MNVKFYFQKKHAKDTRGYIYCKIKDQGNVYRRSLGLSPIPRSAWNQKSERVLCYGGIDESFYNGKIEEYRDSIRINEEAPRRI